MGAKVAGAAFLAICVILAVLLLTGVITIMVSGVIFAVALAGCGTLTSGWRRAVRK